MVKAIVGRSGRTDAAWPQGVSGGDAVGLGTRVVDDHYSRSNRRSVGLGESTLLTPCLTRRVTEEAEGGAFSQIQWTLELVMAIPDWAGALATVGLVLRAEYATTPLVSGGTIETRNDRRRAEEKSLSAIAPQLGEALELPWPLDSLSGDR